MKTPKECEQQAADEGTCGPNRGRRSAEIAYKEAEKSQAELLEKFLACGKEIDALFVENQRLEELVVAKISVVHSAPRPSRLAIAAQLFASGKAYGVQGSIKRAAELIAKDETFDG